MTDPDNTENVVFVQGVAHGWHLRETVLSYSKGNGIRMEKENNPQRQEFQPFVKKVCLSPIGITVPF